MAHTHGHGVLEGHLIAFVELKQQTHLVCGYCNTATSIDHDMLAAILAHTIQAQT
jgi:hypothetical protein